MTTITYKDGIMAGDRRATNGSFILSNSRHKVSKQKAIVDNQVVEYLVGVSGDSEYQKFVIDFVSTGMTGEFRLGEDISGVALVVCKDKVFHVVDGRPPSEIDVEFMAIGSGRDIAIGAMAAGATAAEAVTIASRFDAYTDGNVEEVAL